MRYRGAVPGLLVFMLLLVPAAMLAQDRPADTLDLEREFARAGVPPSTASRLINLYNARATQRLTGPAELPAGQVIRGNVAVLGGSYTVAGRIQGDLLLVGGDLVFQQGGQVTGNVTVVDGRLSGQIRVGGTLGIYNRPPVSPSQWRARLVGDRGDIGGSRLAIWPGPSYNRVEGLPIMLGPTLRSAGEHPLRFEALVIWRSQELAEPANGVGFRVRIEQALGPEGVFRLGATARSVVQPIEDGGLRDLENSLGALLFRSDVRDYYERTGWSGHLRLVPSVPVDALFEYREEKYTSLPAADPWTLFGGGRQWRAQPLVAEGRSRAIDFSARFDTRAPHGRPASAWFVGTGVTHGLGGTLAVPVSEHAVLGSIAPEVDTRFTTGTLDVRRYQRVGPRATLNFRGFLAGVLEGGLVPPQNQRALGGVGTLPGHAELGLDCGARAARVERAIGDGEPAQYFPWYGCDHVGLAQVEYRGPLGLDLSFGRGLDDELAWPGWVGWGSGPEWSLFANAGRGWAGDDWGPLQRADTETLFDVGAGILLQNLGVYFAIPWNGDDRRANLFARWERRF